MRRFPVHKTANLSPPADKKNPAWVIYPNGTEAANGGLSEGQTLMVCQGWLNFLWPSRGKLQHRNGNFVRRVKTETSFGPSSGIAATRQTTAPGNHRHRDRLPGRS